MGRAGRWVVLFAAAALAACGSTSRLKPESAASKREIRDFDRVVVVDFDAKLKKEKKFKDEAKREKYALKVAKAGRTFADDIAKQIRDTGAFADVARASAHDAVDPDALRIGGTITRYDAGNVAARAAVGFLGQTHFEADVVFGTPDGRELGRIRVDHNSWPLPVGSAGSVVQTPGFFMSLAAMKVADELAIAKGARRRGEAGAADGAKAGDTNELGKDGYE
jgi:hypothetical protein